MAWISLFLGFRDMTHKVHIFNTSISPISIGMKRQKLLEKCDRGTYEGSSMSHKENYESYKAFVGGREK